MNNRNQQPTKRSLPLAPDPTAAPLIYLNVFTVEEYERDGETQIDDVKRRTAGPRSAPPSRTKKEWGSASNSRFPIDGRLVVLPPVDDVIRTPFLRP